MLLINGSVAMLPTSLGDKLDTQTANVSNISILLGAGIEVLVVDVVSVCPQPMVWVKDLVK